jgi:hypothetical protein
MAALVEAALQLVKQTAVAATMTMTAAAAVATTGGFGIATTGRFGGTARRLGGGATASRFGGTARGFRGTAARYFATTVAVATQHSVEQFKRIGVGAGEEKHTSDHQARHSETRCHFRTPSKNGERGSDDFSLHTTSIGPSGSPWIKYRAKPVLGSDPGLLKVLSSPQPSRISQPLAILHFTRFCDSEESGYADGSYYQALKMQIDCM